MHLKYIVFQNPSFTRENKCILFHNVPRIFCIYFIALYLSKVFIFTALLVEVVHLVTIWGGGDDIVHLVPN